MLCAAVTLQLATLRQATELERADSKRLSLSTGYAQIVRVVQAHCPAIPNIFCICCSASPAGIAQLHDTWAGGL